MNEGISGERFRIARLAVVRRRSPRRVICHLSMDSFLLTTSKEDAPRLASALNDREFLIVGLCAAWCDTCKEFRDAFESLASTHGDWAFVWLDIEDDSDLAGDIEVDDFPTLAIFHRDRLVHFGASLPQQGSVARLLSSLHAGNKTAFAEKPVTALPALLALHSSVQSKAKAG